jgi:hypothetical protein
MSSVASDVPKAKAICASMALSWKPCGNRWSRFNRGPKDCMPCPGTAPLAPLQVLAGPWRSQFLAEHGHPVPKALQLQAKAVPDWFGLFSKLDMTDPLHFGFA